VRAHPEALVAEPVGLAEVVDPADAGEDQLAAQPGQKFGITAQAMKTTPHGFYERAKPTIAVSQVASVCSARSPC
jgi:hypothetical protein